MARVTVEDCIEIVSNRFDLVLMASQRARAISAGAPLTVDRDNDKNPVVALREIAETTVEIDALEDSLIRSLQRHVDFDEPEEEETAVEDGEALPAPVGEAPTVQNPSTDDPLAASLAALEVSYGAEEVEPEEGELDAAVEESVRSGPAADADDVSGSGETAGDQPEAPEKPGESGQN